jgi:multidrug transporter EmrE-like cation transporter
MIAPCASIAAYFLFGESLSTAKIAAILTIMAGVAWLGWLNS